MGTQSNAAPVIIKRKKVIAGEGHHGGAWKVAYADFVTAMMAFFMLMWLLNATTEKQRKGLADYFSPTVAANRISGGGDGSFGGTTVFSEEMLAQTGTGATSLRPTESRQSRGVSGVSEEGSDQSGEKSEDDALRSIEEALRAQGGETMLDDNLLRHIETRITDEGLIIEFFDLEDARLFQEGTSEPSALLEALARILVNVFRMTSNSVAIEGHVRTEPIVRATNTVWPLSLARAESMRALLEQQGFAAKRLRRVTGYADREARLSNPMGLRNNRLEIILLRGPP